MAPVIHAVAYTLVLLWLLTSVGNWACRLMLNLVGLLDAVADAQPNEPNVGRYIGALERLTIAAGLVGHSWQAIAAVIALKAVGRFKELDNPLPAQYFLLGSLFSILWSIVITVVWLLYDHHLGSGIADAVTAVLGDGK